MGRSETWTVIPVDRAGHRGAPKSLALTFTDPQPSGFHLGIDVAANDVRGYSKATLYNVIRGKLGRDLGGRLKFFGGSNGTLADAVANRNVTGSAEPTPLMCFKAYTQAQVMARADAVTAEEWWVFYQEFQKFIPGTISWTQYNLAHQNIQTWLAGHPNRHLIKICADGAAYQERANGPLAKLHVDPTLIDVLGLDSYSDDSRPALMPPDQLFGDALDWFTTAKGRNPAIGWHVPEWGGARHVTVGGNRVLLDPAVRLQWLKDCTAWLKANGCGGANYWAVNNLGKGNADWSIDQPGDEAIVAWFAANIAA